MNKIVWLLVLPFIAPFMALGFLFSWCLVGFGIGTMYAKEFADWLGRD